MAKIENSMIRNFDDFALEIHQILQNIKKTMFSYFLLYLRNYLSCKDVQYLILKLGTNYFDFCFSNIILGAMNEGSQLDLPSWPFTRPFHITMALFQLHQSIKMKRCRSICVDSGFFSKKIFLHVNGTYQLKNHVCMGPNFRQK